MEITPVQPMQVGRVTKAVKALGLTTQVLAGLAGTRYQAHLQEQAVLNALHGYFDGVDMNQLALSIISLAGTAQATLELVQQVKEFLIFAKKYSLPVMIVYFCLRFPSFTTGSVKLMFSAFWNAMKLTYKAAPYAHQSVKLTCRLIVKIVVSLHSMSSPVRRYVYKEIAEFASRAKGRLFKRENAKHIWDNWVKASARSVMNKLMRAKSAIKRFRRKTPTKEAEQAEKQVNQVIQSVKTAKTPLTPQEAKTITQFANRIQKSASPTPYKTARQNFTPNLRASSSMRATAGSSVVRRSP
jgi:hypothetical protein